MDLFVWHHGQRFVTRPIPPRDNILRISCNNGYVFQTVAIHASLRLCTVRAVDFWWQANTRQKKNDKSFGFRETRHGDDRCRYRSAIYRYLITSLSVDVCIILSVTVYMVIWNYVLGKLKPWRADKTCKTFIKNIMLPSPTYDRFSGATCAALRNHRDHRFTRTGEPLNRNGNVTRNRKQTCIIL